MVLQDFGDDVQRRVASIDFVGLAANLRAAWNLPRARTGIIAVVVVCALSRLNRVLNNLSWNNYTEPKPWDWRREIVLITGGSSGLGEAAVRKLAKRSIKVVVLDISAPKTPFPSGVYFYECDVTSDEAVKKAGEAIRKDIGAPTVLVNNAGIANWSTILEDTPDKVQRIFSVNIFSHFNTVREFLPDMIRNDHGHVIGVSSQAAFVTLAGTTDYSCTKAATVSFHEGLRQDLSYRYNAPHVRTSMLFPTWMRTPMVLGPIDEKTFPDAFADVGETAEALVRTILSGKSCDNVSVPSYMRFFPILRGLPQWFAEGPRKSRQTLMPWDPSRLPESLRKV